MLGGDSMINQNQIDFLFGERRKLTMQVTVPTDTPFTITQAQYTFIHSTGVVEAKDVNCVIDNVNHRFSAVIEPELEGRYTLVWTYIIADEILKRKVLVSVK